MSRHAHPLAFLLAALVGCSLSTVASAQTQVVDLSVNGLDGTAVRWAGPQSNAAASTVLVRGDLNGDVNRPDLIVGAPGGGSGGQGQVFGVFMGPLSTGTVSLSNAQVILTGEAAADRFGSAVSTGQVIRSARTVPLPPRDLVAGAPGADAGKGVVYLFTGPFGLSDPRSATAAPFRVIGNSGDQLGSGVALADMDGDGYRDLIMLASGSGRIYVIYGGPALSGVWDLSTRPADVTIATSAANAVIAVADFNNDGLSDLAVGLPSANAGAGGVYVLRGSPRNPARATLTLPANADLAFTGVDAGDHAGAAIDVADFDGDGVQDLIVAAPDSNGAGNGVPGAGEAYVMFGQTSFAGRGLGAASVTVFGAAAGDHLGVVIAHGHIARGIPDDLVFLASGANAPAGELDVVYGSPRSGLPAVILLANGPDRVLRGDRSAGPIRTALVIEVTGEGAEDIVAGVPGAANGATAGAGLAYVAYSPRLSSSGGTITVAQGGRASTSVDVTNGGNLTVGWAVRSNTSWLTVAPTTGNTSVATPGHFTVTASPGALPTGTYHGGVSVVAVGRDLLYAFTIPVDVTVTAGTTTGPTSNNPFGVPDPPDEGSPNGVATATGTNVQALPVGDVLVTFAHVTAAGLTKVDITSADASSSPGFSYGPWFYHVSTTASYTGSITIGLAHDAGLASRWEGAVKIWSGGSNITSRVDPVRHLVFGVTNSLPVIVSAVDDPRDVTFGSDQNFSYYGAPMTGSISSRWSVYPVNLDGDHSSDFFLYNRDDGRWKMALNDSIGNYRFVDGQWSAGWQVWPLDLNADGYDDFFLYNPLTGDWYEVLNDQHGGFTYVSGHWSAGWTVTPADLNGDGRPDFFVYSPGSGAWYQVFNDPSGAFRYVAGQWSPGLSVNAADFNGDGLSDLFVYNPATGAWSEAISSVSGTFTYQSGQWSAGWTIYPAQMHAGRSSDLFVYNALTGAWCVALNGGTGAFTYQSGMWSPGLTIATADFNADGRTDLFVQNLGTGVWSMAITGAPGQFSFANGRWTSGWVATLADINGDGRTDFWLLDPTGTQWFSAINVAQSTPSDPTAVESAGGVPGGLTVDPDTGNLESQWNPGWQIIPMRLAHTTGAKDLFLYNDRTGQWAKAINDGTGLFAYSGGQWAAGWQVWPLDLNADGYDDLFLYNPLNGAWFKVLNDQHGGFTYVSGQWAAGWKVTPADLNGDGRPDLFVYSPANGAWSQVFNDPSGSFRYVAGQWPAGLNVYAADLNGDGLSDLFLYNPTNGAWSEAFSSVSGTFSYQTGQWSAGWAIYPVKMHAGSAADFFLYQPAAGTWYVVHNTGAGAFTYVAGQWPAGLTITPVDANADGLTDLLIQNPTTGAWSKAITGVSGGFTYQNGQWTAGQLATPADVNGDGRPDFVLYNLITGALTEVIAR